MTTLTDLAKTHIVLKQPNAAFAYLDRADEIGRSAGADPYRVCLVDFTRAQALWDSGRDREEATALAGRARDKCEGTEQDTLDRIDHWLAQRGGAHR